MEFNEKLQQLRKQSGLTQEELAKKLYVSRTAISKWESGRGYPNLDSLKELAKVFSVTVDELLSSKELIFAVEENEKKMSNHIRDIVWGLMDISVAMLLFLPFFAERNGETVRGVSLFELGSVQLYLKITFFVLVFSLIVLGALILALQNVKAKGWLRGKVIASVALSVLCVLAFMISAHPYAGVFAFVLLTVKVIVLFLVK